MSQGSNKKKQLTYLDPYKKARHACAAEADAGGMYREGGDRQRGNGNGAVTLARPCRRRFLCHVSSGVGVLAMRGVVGEVRTVRTWQKKKPTHLERGKRGKAHLGRYGIGDRGDVG